jgi:hypothetical protein
MLVSLFYKELLIGIAATAARSYIKLHTQGILWPFFHGPKAAGE